MAALGRLAAGVHQSVAVDILQMAPYAAVVVDDVALMLSEGRQTAVPVTGFEIDERRARKKVVAAAVGVENDVAG